MSANAASKSEEFELFAPFTKIDERTGEFEAWATLEEIDAAGEIIDLDKSFPYFQALADQFSKNTAGVNFGPLREQHDPQKASGHLIAPPVMKTRGDGVRGIFINGLPTDPVTKDKMIRKTLTGISIGGAYVGPKEDVTINGRAAKKFVANPNHYAPVDSPCVKGALVTMVKVDGSEVQEPLRKEVKQFWDCLNDPTHRHIKKTDAELCDGATVTKADASECDCCANDSEDCGCESKDQDGAGTCACHADCSECEDENCGGLNAKAVASGKLIKLSADARNALPDSAFALPDRRYPIDTKGRARNALARVAQFGTAAEQKKVRAAVHAKYPGIGGDDTTTTDAKTATVISGELSKSLWDVATLAEVIASLRNVATNEQYEEAWEAIEAMREGETPADSSFLTQLKNVISEVYDIMEAIIADERSENDDDVYGELALSAVARGLCKSATAKQAIKQLNKSLRVPQGNGSMSTEKETAMSTNAAPTQSNTETATTTAAATTTETATTATAKSIVCNDPDGLGGDHVHSGGACKAEHVTAENAPIMKAIGALSAKLDGDVAKRAEESTKIAELETTVAKLAKGMAFLLGQPAEPQGALRDVTVAIEKSADAVTTTEGAATTEAVTVRKSNKPDEDDKNGVEKSIEVATAVISKGLRPIKNPVGGSVFGADIQ